MIEIHLLEHLVTFAECGTLLSASEKLSISQPALTRSMQKLEKDIGVKLFTREKNRLVLNDNGKLAADYASHILNHIHDMIENIRALDRRKYTFSLGSCAPDPIEKILPILSRQFEDMIISSELNNDNELLEGIENRIYNLVITHKQPANKNLYSKKCGNEHLYIALPKNHPLAEREGVHLSELDGNSILLYSKIGFWYDLCIKKMPNTKFLIQNNRETFNELAKSLAFPFFTTNHMINSIKIKNEVRNVPILDPESNVTYYCVCRKENKERFQELFDDLENIIKY